MWVARKRSLSVRAVVIVLYIITLKFKSFVDLNSKIIRWPKNWL